MAKTAKVLVVDDDPDIVETLRLVLESANYEVEGAGSPEQAFKKLETFVPDIILLDVMMPDGTEGFHFVWKLRNEYPPELAQIPIVILSAIHETTKLRFYPEQTDGTYTPGEFLPVQGFIDKPAEPGTLLKRIEQVLQLWQ
ncbi:MAG: response regulator [Armatimonadetes bacterium]|nr:response regulator [Armatimonadota bacterium]